MFWAKTSLALLSGVVMMIAMTAWAEEAPSTNSSDLEPLAIELPEAFHGGTPVAYWSQNFEQEDYRDPPAFLAPKGAANVARGKPVSSSEAPLKGALKQITDGDKHYAAGSLIELPDNVQWVQIDLEKECNIYAILAWHFHEGKRVYFDIVVQVSNDAEFKTGVTTVYNNDFDNSAGLGVGRDNEYVDTNKGRLIDAKGISGRFVRLYSRGNTSDDFNHYVEVEVYGIPKTF